MNLQTIIDDFRMEVISKVVNNRAFITLVLIEFTEVECAEFSLFIEGECEITDKTSKRFEDIARKILNDADPNFLIMLDKINNLKKIQWLN